MSTPNAKLGSGGLKKSFFSPCRRIGLPRKIKTPSTPKSVTPPIYENHNSVPAEPPQKCVDTPKRNLETLQVTKSPETPIIRKAVENSSRVETPQKGVERKSRTNQDESNLTTVFGHKSLEEPVEEMPKRSQSKTEPVTKLKNKSKAMKKLESKKENLMKECTVQLETENKPSVLISDSKVNVLTPKKHVKTKKFTKRLSMKKQSVSGSSGDLSEDEFIITKSTSSNSQVEIVEIVSKNNDDVVYKSKRRRTVLSSSEDEDFVTSQSSNKEKVEEDLQVKVQELNEEIKRKTSHLHDLQQASVYKNLHSVEKVGELTQTWRNGCESALRMLHTKLQSHGAICMSSLLDKLHIPSDFLSYNEDNDVFS